MTHEYTILYGATVLTGDAQCPRAAAIAWAADTILAVGETGTVRAISRGDSRFIALPGRLITVAPNRPGAVERSLREAVADADAVRVASVLAALPGLPALGPADHARRVARRLEIGELADLAIWSADPTDPAAVTALAPGVAERFRIEAIVRGGRFTRGDRIHGPYELDAALEPQCLHPGPPGG